MWIIFGNSLRGSSRKFKAYKSERFKKIQSDSRNDSEIRKLIQNSGKEKKQVYSFWIDDILTECAVNGN